MAPGWREAGVHAWHETVWTGPAEEGPRGAWLRCASETGQWRV